MIVAALKLFEVRLLYRGRIDFEVFGLLHKLLRRLVALHLRVIWLMEIPFKTVVMQLFIDSLFLSFRRSFMILRLLVSVFQFLLILHFGKRVITEVLALVMSIGATE